MRPERSGVGRRSGELPEGSVVASTVIYSQPRDFCFRPVDWCKAS